MKYSNYHDSIKEKYLSKGKIREFNEITADKIIDKYLEDIEQCNLDNNIKAFVLECLYNTAWDNFVYIAQLYCEFEELLNNFVNDPENFQNYDTYYKLDLKLHGILIAFFEENHITTDEDFDQYFRKFDSSLEKETSSKSSIKYIFPVKDIIKEDFLINFFNKYEKIENWRNKL